MNGFDQFRAARDNADASGDNTFAFRGSNYDKTYWANGTPVWSYRGTKKSKRKKSKRKSNMRKSNMRRSKRGSRR